jgi:branched-chain amino acid transport system ATP-binding protein
MILTVSDLSLHFGGVKAVDGVSFSVKKGEVKAIIGPNGAGKTSVFNMISRLYSPTSGDVSFEGKSLLNTPNHGIARLGIARTFQNLELFDHASVLENILLGRFIHRKTNLLQNMFFTPQVRKAELADRAVVERIIEFLEIEAIRESTVASLPYGRRKVVELARALALEPSLLLLDEPSSGLNNEETEDLSYWIEDIRKEFGTTILMIEHDMSLVSAVADDIIVLDGGKVLAQGSFKDVTQNPEVIKAYLGEEA